MHHHGSFGVISSVLIFGRATSASRLPYSITPIVFLIRESINRHAGGLKKKKSTHWRPGVTNIVFSLVY